MILRRTPRQLSLTRAQRREPTKAEGLFWRDVRVSRLGVKFRRRVPIGPYVADFACLPAKLIVELDGPVHEDAERAERDRVRDAWLVARGWRVLRVPNEAIFGGADLALDRVSAVLAAVPSSDPAAPGHLLPRAGEGEAEPH